MSIKFLLIHGLLRCLLYYCFRLSYAIRSIVTSPPHLCMQAQHHCLFYMSRKKKECYLEYANPNLNDIVLPFFTLIKAQQLSTGQLHNPTRNVSPPILARETRSGPSILPPRRR